jgi:hypothetical protein
MIASRDASEATPPVAPAGRAIRRDARSGLRASPGCPPVKARALDLFWDRCEGPIVFGVNDCCMVVADVVLAAGGPDLVAGYRGRYRTARGFVRAFRRAGHSTLAGACEAAFSANGKPVQHAADFDVAMIAHFDLTNNRMASSPGVFIGGHWLFRTDRGGAAVPPSAFTQSPKIFRIL